MQIGRFRHNGAVNYGIVSGNEVKLCDLDLNEIGETHSISDLELLAPTNPSKIVCVGRNYAEHAAELGNEVPKMPLLFLKAPSSLIADNKSIIIPPQSEQVEHEGELAIVIKMAAKDIQDDEDPLKYILGFTCLNDVTARDIQRADVQFTRGKSFDTFCPAGPFIETDVDTSDLLIQTKINGEIRQNGRTSQMIFDVPFLIRYISRQMTLLPGDIVATGTPSGVSRMNEGDLCEIMIENIGTLTNRVVKHNVN